ncbi:hypothetical protein [Bartonella grahamii]|uniref:hypothetical protein n=1 Tax=Bartonella grahamii TaxID=33045 RepID=UPI00236116F6|nr:hypothetical protein [Bartonella grahamii]
MPKKSEKNTLPDYTYKPVQNHNDNVFKNVSKFFEAFNQKIDSFNKLDIIQRDGFTEAKTKRGDIIKSTVPEAALQLALMIDNDTKFWKEDIGKN